MTTKCLLCGGETEKAESRKLHGLFGTSDAYCCEACDAEAMAAKAEREASRWAFDSFRDQIRLRDDESHTA